MEEYMVYLEKIWFYLPYMIYAYVFFTILPKSLSRIKKFADADYEASRYKYHRCYAPELCCHTLALAEDVKTAVKIKVRKPVTRIYPKRNSVATDSGYPSTSSEHSNSGSQHPTNKRPVQTNTNVNQIARMFETGGVCTTTVNCTSKTNKKINRVSPTIYSSDLKTGLQKIEHLQYFKSTETRQQNVPPISLLRPVPEMHMMLAENLLDLQDLSLLETCNQITINNASVATSDRGEVLNVPAHWHNEAHRLTRGGTSATPSTASPATSCSPVSASPPASPRQLSPAPALRSSLDDIFAAIALNAEKSDLQFMCSADAAAILLPPVTSIDDILSQRRLSRPLSAYSISDLLLSEENCKIATTEPTQMNAEQLLNNT